MAYFLPEGYTERLGAPQDCDVNGSDEWQREVYEEALKLAQVLGLISVVDFGCGSGFKLLKYFGNRDEFSIIGIDLPQAVDRLYEAHPEYCWRKSALGLSRPDLLICSDVLEHIDDPDQVLELFKQIEPKWLVISTPDRKLMQKYPKWGVKMGPPANGCHVREWSFDEFRRYMDSHFYVSRHFHSNVGQCTQCVIARLKG